MDSYTFIKFKNGTNVKLIHTSCNFWAAKQAMLKTYGKSESDISTTGSNEVVFRPFTVFDGRNFH